MNNRVDSATFRACPLAPASAGEERQSVRSLDKLGMTMTSLSLRERAGVRVTEGALEFSSVAKR
jgi:hypothetical protein